MTATQADAAGLGFRVDLNDLSRDPYPFYAQLRREAPVAWVPDLKRYLVTRHADIVEVERDHSGYTAVEEGSLMVRVMGTNLLRKEGAAHKRERLAMEPALRPATVKRRWMPIFQQIADELMDDLLPAGRADLFEQFAGPCAAKCLGQLLGLYEVGQMELRNWSQAFINGVGNYANDPDIWRKSEAASREIDLVLQDAIAYLSKKPDESLISCMLHAADPLSKEEIAANVKLSISGGLNEPRDAIATGAYALLEDPAQLAQVQADPALWRAVFEETVRWISPIGMKPLQTTRALTLGGKSLPANTKLFLVLSSGNRDEEVFENADVFDINRPKKPHVAFGGGPHFCLGAWAARVQVGEVALPTLFRRARNLRLRDEQVLFGGWAFRGPLNLPAEWDV